MNRYNAGTGPVGPDQDGAVSEPSGLLDLLGVAAAVLDDEGRITLWSPEAERLFGYSSAEALGRYAADLLIDPPHRSQVLHLFARVLSGESWAGGFPIRCKDGTVRQTEFRNVPLQDDQHHAYALGIATDQKQLRELETGLALTSRLFHHAPFGVAVLDPDLRYMLVNPVLEKIHGKPAGETVGRHPSEVIPVPDTSRIEAAMHRVLATGEPLLNQSTLSTTPPIPTRAPNTRGRRPSTGSRTSAATSSGWPSPWSTTPNGTGPPPRPAGCADAWPRSPKRGCASVPPSTSTARPTNSPTSPSTTSRTWPRSTSST